MSGTAPAGSALAYTQSLAHALPPGLAFPRADDSVWMRVLAAWAAMLAELHAVTDQARAEWLPHLTQQRLAEWEEALGLPVDCFGATLTVDQRRAQVLARLRGYHGHYADSSPAALGGLEAYCLSLGYTVTAHVNLPFRCGRNRCGQRLGRRDGRVFVTLSATHSADEAALRCALELVLPARFALVLVFV